jgi:hypothetical protein
MAPDNPTPIRLSDPVLKEADRLAEVLTNRAAGAKITRSEVLRIAVDRGLESLRREYAPTDDDVIEEAALELHHKDKPGATYQGVALLASKKLGRTIPDAAAQKVLRNWPNQGGRIIPPPKTK